MKQRIMSTLAYAGAGLSLVLALLTPFVLMGFFSDAVAHAGLHIDDVYSGGSLVRSVARDGYRIEIYQPVRPRMLQRTEPFVQIAWEPVSALPAHVDEQLDLDGDGRLDVRVAFSVSSDAQAALRAQVVALNERFQSIGDMRKQSFSELIVRTGDRILVRVPLRQSAFQ